MPKRKKRVSTTPSPIVRPKQFLLDESFLLCASGKDCDSIECEDDLEDRERRALIALLLAYEAKVLLVLDDRKPSQVEKFYCGKYNLMSQPVRNILKRWLSGRGKQPIIRYSPAKIKPEVIEDCNLKPNTLDPILCQLAIACRGQAPIWTLASDFWCARTFHPEIKPVCPAEAFVSVR
jgi:hypothetical protein